MGAMFSVCAGPHKRAVDGTELAVEFDSPKLLPEVGRIVETNTGALFLFFLFILIFFKIAFAIF